DGENFGGGVLFLTSLSLFSARPPRRRGKLSLCVRAGRPAHRKHRALADLARKSYPRHQASPLSGGSEAQASGAEALCSRDIGLGELLEQLGLLLSGHADASVGDRELDPVATVGDPARPQPDLALFGELAGIAEEIEQYLPQPHGVHGQSAEVLL